MELAVGEFGNDLKRMMESATKKYYEECDRDEFVIEQEMQMDDGMCFFKLINKKKKLK